MPARPSRILILGGTKEAAELAQRLVARGDETEVTSSLAGRTREPSPLAGRVRSGGFGGADGLARYLRDNAIDCLIDATHPFAGRISENAVAATQLAGVRLIRLVRPPWKRMAGDDWQAVPDLDRAAKAVATGGVVLLALGRQYLDGFAQRRDVTFLVRMVDPPESPLPFERHHLVIGRPSADPAAEAALFSRYGVTHIVCRNSGGRGAYAKIEAARALKLPVIMIDRPTISPGGGMFATVDEVVAAI